MKIKKFNDNTESFPYIHYKLYVNDIEIENNYEDIDDIVADYLEYLKTGFNFHISNRIGNPGIKNAYIIKITERKLNKEIQKRIDAKKYNL